MVAAALVADGRLSGLAVLGATVVACAIADAVWYLAGWRCGYRSETTPMGAPVTLRRVGHASVRMVCSVGGSGDRVMANTKVSTDTIV